MSPPLTPPPLAAIEGLLNPALAAGAALAAVPLLIHLLNRQRHRPTAWAAMRFARAAWKKVRRRRRLENLLLLLLRMGAVAVLAFALARPFTDEGGALSGLTEARRDVVLLVDGSASTGYRQSLSTSFVAIRDRAREVVTALDGGRGDRVHLLLVGDRPRVLSDRSPEEALAMLAALDEPLAEGFDLEAALATVLDTLDAREVAAAGATPELLLLSDGQRGNFIGPGGVRARRSLDALGERGLVLTVEDVPARAAASGADGGGRTPPNRLVESIALLDPFGRPADAGAGAAPVVRGAGTASFLVRVRNAGAAREELRVALEVDGERRVSRRIDLGPGEAGDLRLDAALTDATTAVRAGGFHTIEAVLEGDALEVDDRRALVVHAPPPLEVLLVDGDPGATRAEDEVAWLEAALLPPDAGLDGTALADAAPFRVTTRPADAFAVEVPRGDLDLAAYDVVWLANVEDPLPAWTGPLTAAVEAGATLVVSLGDRVVAEHYAARLGDLLPATPLARRDVDDRRAAYWRARIEAPQHPVLSFFDDERYGVYFTEVPFFTYMACEPREGARVLASLDDLEAGLAPAGGPAPRLGAPLLVEADRGLGRVYLWTSTIDPAWTLLPESPTSLIPLAHELCMSAAVPVGPARNVGVGATILARTTLYPEAPLLVAPDGAARPVRDEPVATDDGAWLLDATGSSGTADRPGVWRLRTASEEVAFAATLDPREGRLERLSDDELAGLHPALTAADAGGDDGADGRDPGGELWRALLYAVLALMVGESLWSARLARARRSA